MIKSWNDGDAAERYEKAEAEALKAGEAAEAKRDDRNAALKRARLARRMSRHFTKRVAKAERLVFASSPDQEVGALAAFTTEIELMRSAAKDLLCAERALCNAALAWVSAARDARDARNEAERAFVLVRDEFARSWRDRSAKKANAEGSSSSCVEEVRVE